MSTTARWRRLSPYLDEALEIADTAERNRWIAALREREPSIADDLQQLLDEHDALDAENFLEWRPHGAAAGDVLGAYRLLSLIGEGGMGAVWLAERSDGRFDRRVAIKFLSVALTGRGEERFTREGRILARLSHPFVAQLMDAGVGDDGRPYLVLEYVEGERIDAYCEHHQLDVEQRLRLFLDVLEAIAHAHANLVVHRDIKPSNVLVDRGGHVKLLDFGVAKLLEAEGQAGEASELTREAGVGLTPEYAAPEQVTNAPITTATDIYSLGVLLYVLLTGAHPAGDSVHSPAHLMKAIVDTEPRRPSDVADARLRRSLRGDLDTIVAKTLKKNPAERYSSVTAFADDIRRHLRHEPIGARPDTLAYRTAKFIRRNRFSVAAATVAAATLVTALVVVNRERVVAERRFDQLRHLSRRVFEMDAEIRNLPGATQARQRLVALSLDYLEGLARDVEGNADLSLEVAEAYNQVAKIQGVPTDLNLGNLRGADDSLAKAEHFIDIVLTARPHDRRALWTGAVIAEDRMIIADSERRPDAALRDERRASSQLGAALAQGGWNEEELGAFAVDFSNLALGLINLRRYDEAVAEVRRELEVARKIPGPFPTASGLSLLANALRAKGDLDGAYAAVREARDLSEREKFSNQTTRIFNLYGVLLREGLIEGEDEGVSLGRSDAAIESLQKAFDMNRALAQTDPKDATSRARIGTAGRHLGNIMRHRDPRRALTFYDAAIARLSEVNNVKAQRDRAMTLADSAFALRHLNQNDEAAKRIAAAVDLLKQTKDLPADRVDLNAPAAEVLRAQAEDLVMSGKPAEGAGAYRRLLDLVAGGTSDPTTDLYNAKSLSRLYVGLAAACDAAGEGEGRSDAIRKRQSIWSAWEQKLPGNPFVGRELQSAIAASQP